MSMLIGYFFRLLARRCEEEARHQSFAGKIYADIAAIFSARAPVGAVTVGDPVPGKNGQISTIAPLVWRTTSGDGQHDQVLTVDDPLMLGKWMISKHDETGTDWDFMSLDEKGDPCELGAGTSVADCQEKIEKRRLQILTGSEEVPAAPARAWKDALRGGQPS